MVFNALKKLAPQSIRHKLMLASMACIVIPAVISLIVYNALTREAVERQAVSNAQDSLQLVAASVTNLLASKMNIVNYIQVNSGMNAYFKQIASGSDIRDEYQSFKEANAVLEQLDSLTVVGEPSYVTVLLTDGSYYMNYSVSDYNPVLLLESPWFEKMKELKGLESYWTGAEPTLFRMDQFDHPYQLSLARTLRKANSEIYGYVVVTFVEQQISNIFNRLSQGNEVLLLDQEGMIVSGRDPLLIGTPFTHYAGHGSSEGYSLISQEDGTFLMVEQELPFAGMRLVVMQPYQEAIVNINAIFNRVLLFQMASFLMFLLLLITLVRTFTKPLVRLGKVTTAVQRGNLEVRSGVHGNDEIGRLGYLFDQMLDRFKEMIAQVNDHQARKRKAELKMLQAQINPHFLFNVLNSIRMKIMKNGDADSAKMVGSLSALLRMTISREEDEIFLHEELDLIAHYISLMNLRQKETVKLELDVAPEAFLMKVPRFFLQPLVENALIHGLNQQAGTVKIQAVLVQEHMLLLTVEDDGQGMDEGAYHSINERLNRRSTDQHGLEGRSSFSGIGLENVFERMTMLFGEGFAIEVISKPGAGTVIEMRIPFEGGIRDVQGHVG